MNFKALIFYAALAGISSVSSAKGFCPGASAPVNCMATALAGESDGSQGSMLAVGKTIMRRVQLGEGNVCSVVYARGQFVGVRHARSKSADWRARACSVAKLVVSKNLVHPYRQFRTRGYTKHRGKHIGGNTFFDTRGGRRAEVNSDGRNQTASVPASAVTIAPASSDTQSDADGAR